MLLARKLAALLVLAGLVLPAFPAQNDVAAIAKTVDRRYNRLKTLRADFVEIYRGAGIARQESGTMLLKRPGKMRWDYRQPREKLFLSDGKTAYFYVPGDRQARKAPIKKLDDLRSPLRFLLGRTRLAKEFDDLRIEPGAGAAGNIVLRGTPKHLADRVADIQLEVTTEGQIVRIVAEEIDGTITEFRFSNATENLLLADSLFKFTVPPGVEVVQGAELEP